MLDAPSNNRNPLLWLLSTKYMDNPRPNPPNDSFHIGKNMHNFQHLEIAT